MLRRFDAKAVPPVFLKLFQETDIILIQESHIVNLIF